jgi:hypothetical protein
MDYATCIATYPNAPAIYCLEVSGQTGQSGVSVPTNITGETPGWQLPTPLQLAAYMNAKGYIFALKNVFGKTEAFAIHPLRRELINFSGNATVKKLFPTFTTPNQIANVPFIALPPNVPFGLLALAQLHKDKIVRIEPGTNDIYTVYGYPPELSYLDPQNYGFPDTFLPPGNQPQPTPPPKGHAGPKPKTPNTGGVKENNLISTFAIYTAIGIFAYKLLR